MPRERIKIAPPPMGEQATPRSVNKEHTETRLGSDTDAFAEPLPSVVVIICGHQNAQVQKGVRKASPAAKGSQGAWTCAFGNLNVCGDCVMCVWRECNVLYVLYVLCVVYCAICVLCLCVSGGHHVT